MVHLYTGNGKGKTTAAIGLITRALGQNQRVCLIQFMKNATEYGEIKTLKKFDNIDIFRYGSKCFVDPENPDPVDVKEAEEAFKKAKTVILDSKYDLIVLDEINVAVYFNLLNSSDQLELFYLDTSAELVMTGRYATADAIALADLVTEMRQIRHYYDKGIQARKGVEF